MSTEFTQQQTQNTRIIFEELELWVRSRIQQWVQELLEEEVTGILGRGKSERRSRIDVPKGYGNGYGKPRRLSLSCGTIKVSRPRVRDLEERFESRILPLFARRTKELGDLIPELYLHGLSQGDFDLALRGLLGEGAPLSEASVARLKAKWQVQYEQWRGRGLEELEVVYLWVDGIYVKAGLERDRACILVALAGLSDGTKVFVGLEAGHRESIESWSGMLRDLRQRGLREPRVVIGDGNLGIWGAIRNVWPGADEQRCWNHKILNVLDKLPKRYEAQGKVLLRQIPYAQKLKEAERLKGVFQSWCSKRGCKEAAGLIEKDWDQMVTFYKYPPEHWGHLRTSNPVESPFSAVRLRTEASRRYKKVESATAIIWKTLMIVQRRFRKLNAPELLKEVYEGAVYADGVRVKDIQKEAAV